MSDALTPTDGHDPAEHHGRDLGEPIPDPGLPEHQPRPTDVDPVLEKRAERQVAGMFGLATVLALAFCVSYFAIDPDSTVFGYGARGTEPSRAPSSSRVSTSNLARRPSTTRSCTPGSTPGPPVRARARR